MRKLGLVAVLGSVALASSCDGDALDVGSNRLGGGDDGGGADAASGSSGSSAGGCAGTSGSSSGGSSGNAGGGGTDDGGGSGGSNDAGDGGQEFCKLNNTRWLGGDNGHIGESSKPSETVGITVDLYSNVYFTGTATNREGARYGWLRRSENDGIDWTFTNWTTGFPNEIAADDAGNIYVIAELEGSLVVRKSPSAGKTWWPSPSSSQTTNTS